MDNGGRQSQGRCACFPASSRCLSPALAPCINLTRSPPPQVSQLGVFGTDCKGVHCCCSGAVQLPPVERCEDIDLLWAAEDDEAVPTCVELRVPPYLLSGGFCVRESLQPWTESEHSACGASVRHLSEITEPAASAWSEPHGSRVAATVD